MPTDVIFLAAGVGKRAKLKYPKQFALIGGKPIMIHSLEIFEQIPEISKIIITSIPELIEEFQKTIDLYNIKKAICIEGGSTRQLSVYKALDYITTERVLIHEAARPFITVNFIEELLSINAIALVPIIDIPFTIVNVAQPKQYPNRNCLKNVQLPQIYKTTFLKAAHEFANKANIINSTDDSSLVTIYYSSINSNLANQIIYLSGIEENIKITTPLDVKLAEVIYDEHCDNNWC